MADHAAEHGGKAVVSQMELHNIRRIFNRFDGDNSGTIDVSELKDVMTSLGVLMDDHHLRELVEQVTSHGREELNFEEFVSLITLWKEASQYKLFDGKGFKSLAQQHVEEALETRSLLPDKPLRAAWDLIVCLSALAYWIWVLLLDAYTHERFSTTGLIVGDVLFTLIYVADTVLSARTCFMVDIRVQDDPRKVFMHYAKTWMVPDLLSAIPFDIILTASGATTAATVLRHLRLLKLLKIPFLWKSSGFVPITSRYIQFHFHILPIFQLLLTFIVTVHGFSIGWVLIKQHDCKDENIAPGTCEYPYTLAVYFVLYTLSTVGLGDIDVVGDAEQWYASFVLCGAMATNGIVIGKLVAILQRADINNERRAKLRETLAVLDHFSIPRQLQEEILQFQAHVFEHNLGAAYEGIVSGLPTEMRINISLFVKMKLVTNVPLFNDSHYMLRIAVAQSLENAVARPEQYVIVHGQHADGLYFLAYGFADVFKSDGSYDGTLRSGDYFGDGALLGEEEQAISVKAITYCDLWILSQPVFANILKRFPKFHRHVEDLRRSVRSAVNPLADVEKVAAVDDATPADNGTGADGASVSAGEGSSMQASFEPTPCAPVMPSASPGAFNTSLTEVRPFKRTATSSPSQQAAQAAFGGQTSNRQRITQLRGMLDLVKQNNEKLSSQSGLSSL
jgi:hypothetical protein